MANSRQVHGRAAGVPADLLAAIDHGGIEKARGAAGKLRPSGPKLVLYGIEGEVFAAGQALSLPVQCAVKRLAQKLPRELETICTSEATP